MIFNNDAKWIAAPEERIPAPLFRKEIFLKEKPVSMNLTVTAVGAHIIYVDGERIDDAILNPCYSDNRKTVYVNTMELEKMPESGIHAIGVAIGRSRSAMKTPNTWGWHNPPWDRQRKFILQLEAEYEDGSTEFFHTGPDWTCAYGPVRYDCLYTGETHDANHGHPGWNMPGFDSDKWAPVVEATPPGGSLRMQNSPPIAPIREIMPSSVVETEPGVILYSFDENVAGNAVVEATGVKEAVMTVHYGEKLFDNNRVDSTYVNVSGILQMDKYVFNGGGKQVFEPLFSYKGFRYIEIVKDPGVEITGLKAYVYHNRIEKSGDFTCSSELLEKIHANSKRALLSNMHHEPTDTPIYEKNGWTGDAQLTAEMAMYNFDVEAIYGRWMVDFADSQKENGEIPPIVPSPNWGYSDSGFGWEAAREPLPAWDYAYFEIPRLLHLFYGNKAVIKEHYPNLVKYIGYLSSTAEGHIIKSGLGDWLPPVGEDRGEEGTRPEERHLESTAYYYRMIRLLGGFAKLLGKDGDADKWSSLAGDVGNAFNSKYLDGETGIYRASKDAPYRQAPNILALAFGIAPPEVADMTAGNLNRDITQARGGHLWTGILGARYILQVLSDNGFMETAFGIVSKSDYPSWGYWIKNGATSLYEDWEIDTRSRNHHMYGAATSWFYSHLAGINPAEPGFASVLIRPFFPEGLDSVSGSRCLAGGKVSCSWKRLEGNRIEIVVELPENVPGSFENTRDFSDIRGLKPGVNKLVVE